MARKAKSLKASEWQPRFIEKLAQVGIVKRAADYAGVHRRTAYAARKNSKVFSAKWDEALEDAADEVEDIVMTAALDGTDIHTSKWVLSRLRPERYGDKRHLDVSGAVEFDVDLNFSLEGSQEENDE